MEQALVLVRDIKSICTDRLDAKTADGRVLGKAFEELEDILNKQVENQKASTKK